MDKFPVHWLAELDEQLHDCHVPEPRRGRIYTCGCGCIWEAIREPVAPHRLRWVLVRDPDRAGR